MRDLIGAVGIWLAAITVAGMVTRFVPAPGIAAAVFGSGMSIAGFIEAVRWYQARHA